jgi:hypothetical protein
MGGAFTLKAISHNQKHFDSAHQQQFQAHELRIAASQN